MGKRFTPNKDREELPQITVGKLNKVLTKLSPNKALGPDRWHPKDLLVLPEHYKVSLIDILHKAEEDGFWPDGIKKGTIALINKPGAEHEGQLRHIGLLTYVHRIWMALRRQTQKPWIQKLHGESTPSAVELAWHTKMKEEIINRQVKRGGHHHGVFGL